MVSLVNNIAIIRRNGLGDTLCTIPLVLYCKKKWPEANVTLFLEEKSLCLAPFLEGPDRIVSIPKGKNKYTSLLSAALKERKTKFDLAFSAKTSPMQMMNLFLFALGARFRYAYTTKSWDSFLVNQRVNYEPMGQLHQAVQVLRLIDPNIDTIASDLYPKLKGVGQRKLNHLPTLFYSVSNNRAGCTLSLPKAASLLNRLQKSHSFCTIINSLPQDRERGETLSSLLVGPSQVLPTESFTEFLEILNSCDAVFVGEGGVSHLAAALKKPIVALFGGTILSRWRPLTDKAICFSIQGHVDDLPEEEVLRALENNFLTTRSQDSLEHTENTEEK